MRGRMRKLLFVIGTAIVTGVFLQFSFGKKGFKETVLPAIKQLPPFLLDTASWADSVFHTLSLEDKVAQMFMVAAYPRKGQQNIDQITRLIKKHKIGGIIFFQGSAEQVAEQAAYYQSISEIPLLMAIDGEWGAAMRLTNTIKYPRQMMLGAISDEMLIYEMGKDIASQLRDLGIHANFAPVVDINNNPENPVINSRSFGEQRVNVARKGLLYMKGMQDEGVLAFAKHFPGHGDTEVDSHFGLPVITHSRDRLDSLELYPFRALINAGVGGVMIAHMNVLAIDDTKNLPSTLSPLVVDSLLQRKLGFKGLVITDAMNMKGVSDLYKPVDANIKAIEAGNDILLMPHEIDKSIEKIVESIRKGKLDENKINRSAQKIIKAKEWTLKKIGIKEYSVKNINTPDFYLNRKKLIEAAVTVVENKGKIIPFRRLDTLKIAHIKLGPDNAGQIVKSLKLYAQTDEIDIKDNVTSETLHNQFDRLTNYNLAIVSLHSRSLSANRDFNISDKQIKVIESIIDTIPTVFVGFMNPYVLSRISNLGDAVAIVEAYENDSVTQQAVVEVLYGAVGANGKLPVTVNERYVAGTGIRTDVLDRFNYVSPYEAGFDSQKLELVDSIIADAINKKALPGCQILAARNGKIFFLKEYGYHTYRKRKPVQSDDIYDLASLTKISSTLPTLMKLQSEKLFDIDDYLKHYLPYLDTSAKGDLIVKDILLHQAGLKSWIPFYWKLLEPIHSDQELLSTRYSKEYPIKVGPRVYANKHITFKPGYTSKEFSDEYPYNIADGLYMRKDIADTIWISILNSELSEPGKYRYSDLGFYIFHKIINDLVSCNLDVYTDSVFYSRLGAYTLCFNPLTKIRKEKIIPTENDVVFRKQILRGYVHDPGAAMLGGVCGHAGLFGSANDLAKLMQVYLNNGRYGGQTYFSKKLISKFTSCIDCDNNRRGIGFDKPQPDTTKPGPGFKGISTESYGHTGFTGTMAWADPSTGILFIFLSNRVFPDAMNKKLISMDVRTNVQEAIYDAMMVE